jgi:hypothetical protein
VSHSCMFGEGPRASMSTKVSSTPLRKKKIFHSLGTHGHDAWFFTVVMGFWKAG